MVSYSGNLHGSTTVIISAVEPSSPTVGLIWQNSTNGEIKIYDGTSFKDVTGAFAIGLAI